MRDPVSTSISTIIRVVAEAHSINPTEFKRRDRRQHFCHARHMVIYCLRYHFPKLTLAEIGSIFGRHHSAIINSLWSHQRLLTHDIFYRQRYHEAQAHLTQLAEL